MNKKRQIAQGQAMHQQHTIDPQFLAESLPTQGILVRLDLPELIILQQRMQTNGSLEVHLKATMIGAAA